MIFGRSCFWRVTMMPARIGPLDARMVIFVALFLLHMRWWTFTVLFMACIVFFVLERRGLSLPSAGRLLRAFLAGARRPAVSDYERRRPVWFGFEAPSGGMFDLAEMTAAPPPPVARAAMRAGRSAGKSFLGMGGRGGAASAGPASAEIPRRGRRFPFNLLPFAGRPPAGEVSRATDRGAEQHASKGR